MDSKKPARVGVNKGGAGVTRRLRAISPGDCLIMAIKALPHVAIIIAGMLIVFFVIDRVNKPIGFMTNEFHKRLTFALSILSIYLAVQSVAARRRAERAEHRRRAQAAKARQDRRQSIK